MTMKNSKQFTVWRRILLINPRLQLEVMGFCVLAIVLHIVFALAVVFFLESSGGVYWSVPWVAVVVSGLLLMTFTTILGFALTNRMFGPLFRLHREIRRNLTGEFSNPIKLRRGDHWQDLISDYNELSLRLRQNGDSKK